VFLKSEKERLELEQDNHARNIGEGLKGNVEKVGDNTREGGLSLGCLSKEEWSEIFSH